ncbi:MAG: ABC transporter ATP-binding protein [Alphaproteobacteria bacterium]
MIIIEHISKSFGEIEAVDDVSFSAEKGVVALLGQNGAGKTTLIRLITSFLAADCGKISLCGHNLEENREKALFEVGYVPENNPIYQDMTTYNFIKSVAEIWKMSKQDFKDSLLSLSESLNIKEVMTQKIATLSKGYKRRVAIVASLIHHPKIVILDEPTDGLDPNQKYYVRKFLKEYSKENLVLISTHIMEDVEAIADRVLLMEKGKLISDTTVEKFKQSGGDMMSAFQKMTSQKRLGEEA